MSRTELFDTAVNKALTYALRLGLTLSDREKLRGGLEPWYLKTRFAYRVPFNKVLEVLAHYPKDGAAHHWQGGQRGRWIQNEN